MAADLWTLYWAFVAFVFGAVTGSFLNVCIWRLPQHLSLSDPPSHCPKCQHRLAFFPDMVPILSQLWYRSRCRYCGVKFSWRYLGVELLTGLVFTAIYYRYVVFAPIGFAELDANWSALAGMIFAAALITVFFIDLDTYTIPDITVAVALLAAVAKDIYLITHGHRPLLQSIPGTPWAVPLPLSVLGCVLAFWLLWQFSTLATALLGREAMGAGDSLLLAAMASFLIPWPLVVIAFIVAVALGTVGGLAGMWLAGRDEAEVGEGASNAESAGSGFRIQDSEVPDAVPSTGGLNPVGSEGCVVYAAEVVDPAAEVRADIAPIEPEGVPAYASEVHDLEADVSADGTFAGQRGAVELPTTPPENPSAPELPASSRWGRLWTVVGTWVVVGGLWGGAVLAVQNRALGIGVGAASLMAGVLLLRYGIQLWLSKEEKWAQEMDEFFDNDPGPRFIPFGPYLVAGTFVAMCFGRQIVLWYAVGQLGMSPESVGRLPWD